MEALNSLIHHDKDGSLRAEINNLRKEVNEPLDDEES